MPTTIQITATYRKIAQGLTTQALVGRVESTLQLIDHARFIRNLGAVRRHLAALRGYNAELLPRLGAR